jgi:hypothetical protein
MKCSCRRKVQIAQSRIKAKPKISKPPKIKYTKTERHHDSESKTWRSPNAREKREITIIPQPATNKFAPIFLSFFHNLFTPFFQLGFLEIRNNPTLAGVTIHYRPLLEV